MSKLTQAQILAKLGANARSSVEDNDVNIHIAADVEADNAIDPETLDTSTTPEAAELDVLDQQADVENAVDDAEEMNEVVSGLEALYVEALAISEEGLPMDGAAARLLQCNVANLTRKFGLTPAEIGVASVEDYGVFPESSHTASLEGIGDTIKAGITRLVEFLKNIWNKITGFVKGLFDSTLAARNKNKALQAKLKDKGVTGKEVTVSALVAADVTDASAGSRNLVDFATEVNHVRFSLVLDALGRDDVGPKEINEAMVTMLDGLTKFTEKRLFGGHKFSIADSGLPQYKRVENLTSRKVKLTRDQVQVCLNGSDNLIKCVEKYKGKQAQQKSVNDAMTKIVKQTAAKPDAKMMQAYKARSVAVSSWNSFVSLETSVMASCLSVANALNNAAAASIGKAKEAK